jgi:hypothetical protein
MDAQGNRLPMSRCDVVDLPSVGNLGTTNQAFMLKGDVIVVLPTPTTTGGYLEIWYYQRANDLVLTEAVGKITAIEADTPIAGQTTYTVDADLSAYSEFDFLSATSPFVLWAEDVEVVSISTTQLIVTSSAVSNDAGTLLPQLNDYICPRLTANIPMVPQEFHPLLAEMGAERVLQALGHTDKLQACMANIESMRKRLFKLVANRIEQKPIPIVNRNSLLRFSGFGSYRGGGGF